LSSQTPSGPQASSSNQTPSNPTLVVGRYALYEPLAAGGMATVHIGRLFGEAGFSRTVAIKRLHPHLALMPEFAASFVDEARIAARIRHPNVIPTLDVVSQNTSPGQSELFLVMDYVEGATLSQMWRHLKSVGSHMPVPVACAILSGVLHGLHAAHEARGDGGVPLDIVHRDVSPQNVLVGIDGVPRVLDFGIAKAMGQLHLTQDGRVKGKLAYMAPEQALGGAVSRQTDIFAASVVLWEALTGLRLFEGDSEGMVLHKLQHDPIPPPSMMAKEIPEALDAVVLRGLARDPSQRYRTAEEMAVAIETATALASAHVVGQHVRQLGGERLQARAQRVAEIESVSSSLQLFTGSGIALRSASATPAPAPAPTLRSEWWKIAIFAGALLILLPLAWWLTRKPPAASATGAVPITATATATVTATATATATATVAATATVTATAAVTATETATATATATSTGRKTKPGGTAGGKLYGRE
jgi:serine/threonine-protein kinase